MQYRILVSLEFDKNRWLIKADELLLLSKSHIICGHKRRRIIEY